jgi:polyhydroxybutyrate depolymerase
MSHLRRLRIHHSTMLSVLLLVAGACRDDDAPSLVIGAAGDMGSAGIAGGQPPLAGSGGMESGASGASGATSGGFAPPPNDMHAGGSGAVDAASPDAADSALDAGQDDALDCELSQSLAPGDHDFMIASANGLTYSYTLVVPETVMPGKKAPLVVVWHALQSSPEETRGLTNIDEDSSAHGTITVHPRSPDASWDVGECCSNLVLFAARRDEEIFARELLADVQSKVCVDDKHVYTSGFSNGGMISQMLACKMSDVFAAAAPMGSTLTIPPSDCQPTRPIPIMMINGTADPLVGYDAPSLSGGIAATDAFELWADRNLCTGAPVVTLQRGAATCESYTSCAGGVEVTLCSIEGMGHCMPGMEKESATNCFTKLIPLGPPNDDINGVELTGAFLARYALP